MAALGCDPASASAFNGSLPVALLLPVEASAAVVCALAAIVKSFEQCTSVAGCSFYWTFSVLLFGILHREQGFLHSAGRVGAWDQFHLAMQRQLYRARARDLRPVAREQLDFYGHPRPPPMPAAESASVLLLYGDRPAYFQESHVLPFVRQLRCYAESRGMRFVVDDRGPREPRRHLMHLDVSIKSEYFVVSTTEDPAKAEAVEALADALFRQRDFARAIELPSFEGAISVHYGQPLHFGRIWAIEEQLNAVEPGALVIYYDADVTIRPDSWHRGIVERLLEQPVTGKEPAHVFIADTWIGTECVNSGFVAVRNTRVGRLFLELWRQKLWWAASWDQTALAETVLELIGAEVWKLSGGKRLYDSRCLPNLMPVVDATYSLTRYCDCWQGTLEDLTGPYRQRQSRLIGFVDPERMEVNFIPNNLFWDHNYQLDRMRLVARPGRALLRPMVVHWAGLGHMRLTLSRLFLRENFNLSVGHCPSGPRWDFARLAARPELAGRRSFGTRARHLRCCEKLREYPDRSGWPWNEGEVYLESLVHWWGCSEWRPVIAEDCEDLLGQPIRYTGI